MQARHFGLALVLLAVVAAADSARSATIQFLSPFGLNFGVAWGVDGEKVVGESNIGWLYDGATYQVIQVPWGGGNDTLRRVWQ